MAIHSRSSVEPTQTPAVLPLHVPHPEDAFLAALPELATETHVFVLGHDRLELMCALLRAGAAQVTEFRSTERMRAGSASLVIVPKITSLEWLASALPAIRRALVPNGRLIVGADALPSVQGAIRRLLQQHAFAPMRTRHAAGRLLISVQLPTCDLRRCA